MANAEVSPNQLREDLALDRTQGPLSAFASNAVGSWIQSVFINCSFNLTSRRTHVLHVSSEGSEESIPRRIIVQDFSHLLKKKNITKNHQNTGTRGEKNANVFRKFPKNRKKVAVVSEQET